MLKRRLYLQIYLTIIASLVMVALLAGLLWNVFGRQHIDREIFDVTVKLATKMLPPPDAPIPLQRRVVEQLNQDLEIGVALYDADGLLVAAAGDRAPPRIRIGRGQRRFRMRRGRMWTLRLPDQRWLLVDFGRRRRYRSLLNLLLFLAFVSLGVGVSAYPFVRRLTGRLERLQQGVERIGAGDLSARVTIEGSDEVAQLASSFNDAANKIETLVGAHRLLLANTSHELRTPLARIRLGIEMLRDGFDERRFGDLQHDIAELDGLIDEILLMNRLDMGSHADTSSSVDLVALAAEECARYETCTVKGNASDILGDERLLRRLLRNLLDNAVKHGVPPIDVLIADGPHSVTVTVSDGGPGIDDALRDKVFQPFYRAPGTQNIRGHGLGLSLVRQIAEAHGGSIEILPRTVAQSAIRVNLPASAHRSGAARD